MPGDKNFGENKLEKKVKVRIWAQVEGGYSGGGKLKIMVGDLKNRYGNDRFWQVSRDGILDGGDSDLTKEQRDIIVRAATEVMDKALAELKEENLDKLTSTNSHDRRLSILREKLEHLDVTLEV